LDAHSWTHRPSHDKLCTDQARLPDQTRGITQPALTNQPASERAASHRLHNNRIIRHVPHASGTPHPAEPANWEGKADSWNPHGPHARAYTNSIRGAAAPESGSPHCPWRSGSSRDRGIGTLRAPVIRHRRRTANQIRRPNHRARTWMELPLPTAAGAAEGDEPERPELMIKNRRRSRGESRRSGAGPGNGDGRVGGRSGGYLASRRRAAAARWLGWLAGWLRRSGREGEESCGRHSTVGKRKRGRHATRRRGLPGRAGGLRLSFQALPGPRRESRLGFSGEDAFVLACPYWPLLDRYDITSLLLQSRSKINTLIISRCGNNNLLIF
jgi:hypothetical protein